MQPFESVMPIITNPRLNANRPVSVELIGKVRTAHNTHQYQSLRLLDLTLICISHCAYRIWYTDPWWILLLHKPLKGGQILPASNFSLVWSAFWKGTKNLTTCPCSWRTFSWHHTLLLITSSGLVRPASCPTKTHSQGPSQTYVGFSIAFFFASWCANNSYFANVLKEIYALQLQQLPHEFSSYQWMGIDLQSLPDKPFRFEYWGIDLSQTA